jgi:hypothetical protein
MALMKTEGKAVPILVFGNNLFVGFMLPPLFRGYTHYGSLTDHLTRADGHQLQYSPPVIGFNY